MEATLYDGMTAKGHAVGVAVGDGMLDGDGEAVAIALLRSDRTRPQRFVVHRIDRPDWRLVFAAEPDGLPRLAAVGRLSRSAVSIYALCAGSAVAAAVLLWMFGGLLLDVTAPLVPHRTLHPIGRGLAADIGGRPCTDPAGKAALAELVARLTPAKGFVEPVTVGVTRNKAVNAFAAPGGHIVIFGGLIAKAAGPDEVAGVLAHELGHVQHRDATKALLRHMGGSLLLQSVGGTMGGIADFAVLLDTSRDAERAADTGAVKLLADAGVSPTGLATFFSRARADAKDKAKRRNAVDSFADRLASYTATHSGDEERIAAIAPPVAATTPALREAEWQALRAICTG